MTENFSHQTVLLQEAVDALKIESSGCYVDGTFGRGGHSREILKRLGSDGCLLAMDKDARAIEAGEILAEQDQRFRIQQGSFLGMAELVAEAGQQGKVNGILLDLGVSSPQLDDASRGFSFNQDGPLDMRMDDNNGETAAEWINRAEEGEIANVLKEYGEERFSRRIARAIVEARLTLPFATTRQLAEVVSSAIPKHEKHKHPATRSFQAIRIKINHELEELQQVLGQALDLLASGGRLVVISFHSLEDRIVKRFMRDQSRGDRLPAGLPVQFEQSNAVMKLVGKAVFAGEQELSINPRARSAVMRIAEKL
ncbi:MAG: 16S rRNA (cytosine(1402)-N(4))-methyltransferase RsmH [Gammaproteobacteria bacterium]